MKDAYSFHATEESLDEKYKDMMQAYTNIFTRLGLDFRAVIADGGSIGGTGTHELWRYRKLVKIRLLTAIHRHMQRILKWLK